MLPETVDIPRIIRLSEVNMTLLLPLIFQSYHLIVWQLAPNHKGYLHQFQCICLLGGKADIPPAKFAII